jgi:hypothetical protein
MEELVVGDRLLELDLQRRLPLCEPVQQRGNDGRSDALKGTQLQPRRLAGAVDGEIGLRRADLREDGAGVPKEQFATRRETDGT